MAHRRCRKNPINEALFPHGPAAKRRFKARLKKMSPAHRRALILALAANPGRKKQRVNPARVYRGKNGWMKKNGKWIEPKNRKVWRGKARWGRSRRRSSRRSGAAGVDARLAQLNKAIDTWSFGESKVSKANLAARVMSLLREDVPAHLIHDLPEILGKKGRKLWGGES